MTYYMEDHVNVVFCNIHQIHGVDGCDMCDVEARSEPFWQIVHVSPEGVKTVVEECDLKEEAEQNRDYLMELRDPAQWLDGTTFEVQEAHRDA